MNATKNSVKQTLQLAEVCVYCHQTELINSKILQGTGRDILIWKKSHPEYLNQNGQKNWFHRACYYKIYLNVKNLCDNCCKKIKDGNEIFIANRAYGSTCAKKIKKNIRAVKMFNETFNRNPISVFSAFDWSNDFNNHLDDLLQFNKDQLFLEEYKNSSEVNHYRMMVARLEKMSAKNSTKEDNHE